MGYIYKVTNLINQKIYIGLTYRDIQTRWSEHKSRANNGSTLYFHNAIRKYDLNNFYIEQIDEADGDTLKERERYWINYYKSNNREFGYNLTNGGDGNLQLDYNQIYELWNNNYAIVQIANELNIDRSTVRKILQDYKNFSEQEAINRGLLYQSIKVNKYNLNGEFIATFNSLIEAGNGDKVSAHSIGQCCSGKLQTALGYQWKYYNDTSNIYPAKNFKLYKRKVLQYAKDNEYLNSFNSLREAASTLTNNNLKVKTIANQIGQVCKGNRKTAYGYIWKYDDDNI